MSDAACQNCGSTLSVAPVTYTYGEQRVTQPLCQQCKAAMLGRRRARHAPAHRRQRHHRRGGWTGSLKQGGPLAYVGVGLFVLGLVLLPTLIAISLLTR
jgi:hypothetical protein